MAWRVAAAWRHEPALTQRRSFDLLQNFFVEAEPLIGFVRGYGVPQQTVPRGQRFPIRPYIEHLEPRWIGHRPYEFFGVSLGLGEGSSLGITQALQEHPGARVRRLGALDERVTLLGEEPVFREVVEDEPDDEAGSRRDADESREHTRPEGER